jgi:rifampicin phosphotransferase
VAILERTPAVLSLSDSQATNLKLTGGKGANLAKLVSAGLPVPDGFCVTTAVYEELADDEEMSAMIDELEATDPVDTERLRERAAELRDTIRAKELPQDIQTAIEAHLEPRVSYVARSSATAEDLPTASFAGQHSTVLDVSSLADVTDAVLECMASLFTDRAVSYRARNEIAHEEVSMCVVVQEMIDANASGVLFTADPLTGKRTVASIDASTGLGEAVVSGTVTAESVRVDRESGGILEYRAGVSGDDGSDPVGANEPTADIEQETSPTTTSDQGEADKSEHDEGGPAFSFDETTAKSIYVREETLDILENTELEIELLLRQEHDIRDITGREVMDAVLRVAAENPEAVADQIIAERDGHSDG